MEKLRTFCFVVAGLILLCGAPVRGGFVPCTPGWFGHGQSCFKVNSTAVSFSEAQSTCASIGGELASIKSRDENSFVKTYVQGDFTWIGAKYQTHSHYYYWYWLEDYNSGHRFSYSNFDSYLYSESYYSRNPCLSMKNDGRWKPRPCESSFPFVCETDNDECETGWFGRRCNERCHCFEGDTCDQQSGLCPRGCINGWTGSQCNTRNPSPSASYYCLKTLNGSLRAFMTMHPNGREFPLVRAVNQNAEPRACSGDRMTVRPLYNVIYVELLLPGAFGGDNVTDDVSGDNDTSAAFVDAAKRDVVSGDNVTDDVSRDNDTSSAFVDAVKEDDCLAEWSENGTVTWLIKFKRYEGITIRDDVTVKMTCDMNNTMIMEDEKLISDVSDVDGLIDPGASPVKVTVVLTDVHAWKEVNTTHTGQDVKLEVKVEGLKNYQCPYPHSCVARAKDAGADDEGVMLVNEKGCPAAGSPITEFRVGHSSFSSNEFKAFTLGSDSVDIVCKVDIVQKSGYDCPAPDCSSNSE